MENFILIALCLGAGLLLQRSGVFPTQAAVSLNLYVIWVALPALILRQVPTLTFSSELLTPLLLPWIMVAVGAGLALLGTRLFLWPRGITGILLLTIPLGNTSFLGIPMITAFFGE